MKRPYHHQRYNAHPTLILATILAVGLAMFVKTQTGFQSTEKQTMTKIDMLEVGNIDATSVSILVKTVTPENVRVKYGDAPNKLVSSVSQLNTSEENPKHLSFFEIESLQPQHTYYFQFVTKGNTVVGDPTVVYEFTTSAKRGTPLTIQPIYGKALSPQDTPETDAFVLLQSDSFAPLITPINSDGTFLFSLCCLVSKKSEVLDTLKQTAPVTIEIHTQERNVLSYQTTLDDVTSTTTLLTIQKGKHSIKKEQKTDPLTENTTPTSETSALTQPEIAVGGFSLMYPQANALIPGNQPLFKGTAQPESIITIKIKEDPSKLGKAQVNKNGTWSYNPSFKLLFGKYTALISGTDETGTLSKIERPFQIAKSGEAVLGEATGSATITPMATISPTLTSTPTGALTATPSQTIVTTYITPTPPVTGFNPLPLVLSSTILVIIGLSILSFF